MSEAPQPVNPDEFIRPNSRNAYSLNDVMGLPYRPRPEVLSGQSSRCPAQPVR